MFVFRSKLIIMFSLAEPVRFPLSSDHAKSALYSWSGKLYLQFVIIQGIGVEHADRFIGFALRAHCYKCKALAFTVFAVLNEMDGYDFSGLCEQGIQFLLGS